MLAQTPVQIAWVTRDLDATERALTTLLGAKKWVRMPDVHFAPDTCTFRGEPADFVASISLSYAGDTQLELISPVSGHSVYTEYLDAAGPGLHHICVEKSSVEEFDGALADADEVVAAGVMPGGMQFAYVAAPAAGVPYVEIAYIPDEIKAFFEYIKQEQK
ncbi:VOC family protein [Mycolicibacterium celeriflavum]|uniref:Lactoylglutathione lyase n=1 Tax=Mycolicibacterium celeriflavum TaxID=1249101 RepID=A0A1X0BT87_MYCCF|nr:VOC family protein [Mycolicibacterium celeriflavum]MCV7238811.1 VOC family protein [Mycolicibacterium celeriflavum]ORA46170.1 lactoylglutathione lyase [Mycolicibacterium celeriflavum]BBY42547.1 lactoylglutathione lyase [Mycolicibacterium celeriflavum]